MSFQWSLYWRSVVAPRIVRDSASWIFKGPSKELLVFNLDWNREYETCMYGWVCPPCYGILDIGQDRGPQ